MKIDERTDVAPDGRRRSFLKKVAFGVGLGWVGGSLLAGLFGRRLTRARHTEVPKVTPHPQAVSRTRHS